MSSGNNNHSNGNLMIVVPGSHMQPMDLNGKSYYEVAAPDISISWRSKDKTDPYGFNLDNLQPHIESFKDSTVLIPAEYVKSVGKNPLGFTDYKITAPESAQFQVITDGKFTDEHIGLEDVNTRLEKYCAYGVKEPDKAKMLIVDRALLSHEDEYNMLNNQFDVMMDFSLVSPDKKQEKKSYEKPSMADINKWLLVQGASNLVAIQDAHEYGIVDHPYYPNNGQKHAVKEDMPDKMVSETRVKEDDKTESYVFDLNTGVMSKGQSKKNVSSKLREDVQANPLKDDKSTTLRAIDEDSVKFSERNGVRVAEVTIPFKDSPTGFGQLYVNASRVEKGIGSYDVKLNRDAYAVHYDAVDEVGIPYHNKVDNVAATDIRKDLTDYRKALLKDHSNGLEDTGMVIGSSQDDVQLG